MFSDGWPRRLVEAPPELQRAVLEAMVAENQDPPFARCLAIRGVSGDPMLITPWYGSAEAFREECTAFVDVHDFAPEKEAKP